MNEYSLINPTAPVNQIQPFAKRPPSLNGAHIALIDGMLNPSANWGQGLLDGVSQCLQSRFTGTTFERISRPQLTPNPPEIWAEAMADQYMALVIAAGD